MTTLTKVVRDKEVELALEEDKLELLLKVGGRVVYQVVLRLTVLDDSGFLLEREVFQKETKKISNTLRSTIAFFKDHTDKSHYPIKASFQAITTLYRAIARSMDRSGAFIN